MLQFVTTDASILSEVLQFSSFVAPSLFNPNIDIGQSTFQLST